MKRIGIVVVAALTLGVLGYVVRSQFGTPTVNACDQSTSFRSPGAKLLAQVEDATRDIQSGGIVSKMTLVEQTEFGKPNTYVQSYDVKQTPAGTFGIFTSDDGKTSDVYYEGGKGSRRFKRGTDGAWTEVKPRSANDQINPDYVYKQPRWGCKASEVSLIADANDKLTFRLKYKALNDGATDMVTIMDVDKQTMLPSRKTSTWRETYLYKNQIVTDDFTRICEFSELGATFTLPADLPVPRT